MPQTLKRRKKVAYPRPEEPVRYRFFTEVKGPGDKQPYEFPDPTELVVNDTTHGPLRVLVCGPCWAESLCYACQEKKDAAAANNGRWRAKASDISREWLARTLESSVEQLAWSHYRYWLHLASSKSERSGLFIDPLWRGQWKACSGKDAPVYYTP